ncbi:hypothetical protein UFOVP257_438 [uncultured Caudovirales phage]|uniref:Baseplate wedge subunit n=1 Tax=uncultured Caudovirales phage TaxID=2100421 RepID=A0A6J5LKS4_9CAUD|nr:hypothetical protein UFOVP257_438 [uncultured Caudovirales phage]
MALTTRQTSLLVQQDWTKIYQTFREADFQSFDFETIRKSMIEYLRTYYPEDFNDFTESSEYVALIDLIAFLGQSLAFRTDLNARENFLDTAERRDSILKLAKLLSYSPKRNVPASGYLKFDSVSTTEAIYDSYGTNLSGLVLGWNDTTNQNWLEQFTAVINASLVSAQVIGKPGATQTLNGVKTDEYAIKILGTVNPLYPFNASIAGVTHQFEIVSATSYGQSYIYEKSPVPDGTFNFLYRNDNQGNSSNDTGYFFYFKQGNLSSLDFSVTETLPNRVVNINFNNINNTDVWMYALNSNGTPTTKWTQVPAVNGVNVIYNNNATERNLFSVNTRANDQVDLVFGDGSFTNIPVGNFRVYYRSSNNLNYKITPDEMSGITVAIPYRGKTGRTETLTIRASLHYSVTNASSRETLESIRTKAPQQYYTQNRMITGEDYNILPYTTFNNILKLKAVNRASSGISRYLDVVDATGKYSSTNIFAEDGLIYKENYSDIISFQFTSSNEVNNVLQNTVRPMLSSAPVQHLYYSTATRSKPQSLIGTATTTTAGLAFRIETVGTTDFTAVGASENTVGTIFISSGLGSGTGTVTGLASWNLTSVVSGRSIGTFSAPNYTHLSQGALIKFVAPTGKYFDAQNQLQTGTPINEYQKTTLWASIISYPTPGSGTATLSIQIPTGAIIDQIIPVFANDWSTTLLDSIANYILSYKNFGLRYDLATETWVIVTEQNLDTTSDFSMGNAGDTSSSGLDASWLLYFSYANQTYTVTARGVNYFFQSVLETRFYYDPNVKVYDSNTATVLLDEIKVLRINTLPDSSDSLFYSQYYKIWDNVVGVDGYEDNRKILITFPDRNFDGVPDDPDLFENLVAPSVNASTKYLFFKQVSDQYNFLRYDPIEQGVIVSTYATYAAIVSNITLYPSGTIFYATSEDTFYELNGTLLSLLTGYLARIGRQDILFQYTHNSPNSRRVDPSPNNIIDFYILTKDYSDQYFSYIQDTSGRITEPTAPTNEVLKTSFGSIESYKAISDSIIYNTAKFKPLFGSKANSALQAIFKVVKNPNVNISDNDVKSQVVSAINAYFDITNWDFGETFYFSELSAYLHTALSPNVSSIIIVPSNAATSFGTLFQINAEPNEIVTSAATVDNVQIISAITAGQINLGY